MNSASSPRIVSLPPKSVEAGAASELDLSGIANLAALDGAAIKIESNGSAASVIASLVNHSRDDHIVRSAPFKDIGDYGVSTGAYPWRLDGHFDSRIYITNVGKVRAAFGGHILPANGPSYFVDSHYLNVGETAMFDIRAIRDQQTPDPLGVKLLRDGDVGQFKWTTLFGDGSQRLIGRNELVDRITGISASFSCNSCQCPSSVTAASVSPDVIFVENQGQFGGIIASATSTDTCSGTHLNNAFDPSSWSVASPSILSLTSGQPSSTLKGLSAGASSFYTPFDGIDYGWNGQTGSCFVAAMPQLNPGGNGTVADAD